MKKIILGMLVLGSSITGITQATVMNMTVGQTYDYGGASITCDNNANCISTFSDVVLTGLIQGSSLQSQIIIRVGDDLAYFRDYGTYNFSKRIMEGCFTSLTNGVNANDYILARIPDCSDSSGNFNTWIENASTYGGKLTSLTFNTFGNQGLICWNYNEELGSFCVQFATNQYNEDYDWGMVSPITTEKLINIGMSDSPFNGGGNNGPTTLPMCYTIQQKINTYPSNYSIDLCYSTNKIWSGGQFVTVTPKNMMELWSTYQEYVEDANLYQNYCNNTVATQEACIAAFTGQEEKWSILNKIRTQGTTTRLQTYEYCYLQLSFTEEQKNTRTNCTMGTGLQHGSGITTEQIIEDRKQHHPVIIIPGTNTVYSGMWNNNEQEQEQKRNIDEIIESTQNVRGKLITIIHYRSGVNGIIPNYITRIILLIILFAVFKK